jgi:GxxExxY protein
LELRGIPHRRQVGLPVVYKGEALGNEFVMDVLVEERLILELKTVEKLEPIHQAQLLTYMKPGRIHLGLLINFNVQVLRDGIKRMIL